MIAVSLFASSVRPKLYDFFFKSLEGTSVEYEVVFAGNNFSQEFKDSFRYGDKPIFIYVKTANIKPAQCYEIARRNCQGDVVVWVADDCEFPNDVIGKAYKYWQSRNNEKLILSIQTRETGYGLPQGKLFDMDIHRFFGGRLSTPLMAPLGLMSRTFLEELGGIDRRYVCGQYENDIVMRARAVGGSVEVFGDKETFIDIDHLGKSLFIGESKTQNDFLNRPFAIGYYKDRQVLEGSWTKNRQVVFLRNDQFEPFEDVDLLVKSQSNKGIWE